MLFKLKKYLFGKVKGMSGVVTSCIEFEYTDFSNFIFVNCRFHSIKFKQCNFSNAVFDNTQFYDCDFIDCQLTNTVLESCSHNLSPFHEVNNDSVN